jgi:hypothetical protein
MPTPRRSPVLRLRGQQDWRLWAKHPVVRKAGGLVHPGTLGPFERSTCGLIRYLFREAGKAATGASYSDRFEGLSLFFIDNPQINAMALEDGPRRGVGVHVGAAQRVWALLRLANETSEFLSATFDNPAPEASGNLFAIPEHWPEQRLDYLFEFYLYAADFIVNHELAHHARGHLDLVRDELGLAMIDEGLSMSAAPGSQAGRLLQLIEFDADHHALDMILQANVRKGFPDQGADWLMEDAFKLMLTVILIFLAFDLDHRPVDEAYIGSHPSPIYRAMRLTAAIVTTFHEAFGLDHAKLQDTHDWAWCEAADVARHIGMPEGRWWGEDEDIQAFQPRLEALEEDFFAFSRDLDQRNLSEG